MKNLIFPFLTGVFIVFFIASIGLNFFSISKIEQQSKLIAKQDTLINKLSESQLDSLNKSREYADSIKGYVDEITFQMNGKKLSTNDFVKLFNKIDRENLLRKDSLIIYKNFMNETKKILKGEIKNFKSDTTKTHRK